MSSETFGLSSSMRLAVDFLQVTYIEGNEVLVFNLGFDLMWTGRGSAGISASFVLGKRELK